MRPTRDEYYLNIAKAVAARSTCLRRQYGAVIVNNNEIIATGFNGAVRGGENCCDLGECPRQDAPHNSGNYGTCRGVHAEQNAIISAARRDMIGGTIYLFGLENGKEIVDIMPCPLCQKMIINAGLKRVVVPTEELYQSAYFKKYYEEMKSHED